MLKKLRPAGRIGSVDTWLAHVTDPTHSLAAMLSANRIGFIEECWLQPAGGRWTEELILRSGHTSLEEMAYTLRTNLVLRQRIIAGFAEMTVPRADVSACIWNISFRQIPNVGDTLSIVGGKQKLMAEHHQLMSAAQAA